MNLTTITAIFKEQADEYVDRIKNDFQQFRLTQQKLPEGDNEKWPREKENNIKVSLHVGLISTTATADARTQ